MQRNQIYDDVQNQINIQQNFVEINTDVNVENIQIQVNGNNNEQEVVYDETTL